MEPKIRLKGFSGKWEETTFDKSVTINSGMDYKHLAEGNIPVYGTGGYMLSVNESLSDVDAIGIGRKGTIDKPQLLKAPFWTVDTLFFMTPKNGNDLNFLYALSQKINWRKYDESTGVPSLSKLNIGKIEFVKPERKEQHAIASYFQHLDSLIQSTTKKIESLKQVKAASLQSMFPQEGETTPRVRFKGFEGEWENVKFAAFAEINRGLTYTPVNIVENGVRVLRSSNIDNDVFAISNEDVFVTPNCINICYAKEGDILITAANGSPRLVGKHAIIRNTGSIPVVAGGFMYLVTSQESEFLNASMSSDWYWRFLKIGVAGGNGSIGNLNRNDLEETVFPIPSLKEERNMIASYFTSLDSQIFLHSQRLEKLKQIKSACLDNMFV